MKNLITLLCLFTLGLSHAQSGFINFDGMFAPTVFIDQNTPADAYSDGYVTFTGGAEVLDCRSFTITGFSTPNALKFNPVITGTIEDILFDGPTSGISFNAGFSATPGNLIVEAFDENGASVEVQSFAIAGSGFETVTISSTRVTRVRVSLDQPGYVDDIAYTRDPLFNVPTLSQWGLIILGLFSMIFAVAVGRSQTKKLFEKA
ncbi:IPTL-CTERM sorting domain-containing protein [Portibacter marinus]|uniref:IPTL-CTERM sorting domain-containing protein n=1 Tax=Portibacter marinus TaxID=2898660 RepID=UPI001F15ACA8|nr:IPTL-CTERM sorting domain-containing protein [Portibacter marinus]